MLNGEPAWVAELAIEVENVFADSRKQMRALWGPRYPGGLQQTDPRCGSPREQVAAQRVSESVRETNLDEGSLWVEKKRYLK
jgi:hypothetical protein